MSPKHPKPRIKTSYDRLGLEAQPPQIEIHYHDSQPPK